MTAKKAKAKREKAAAVLSIFDAPGMTARGRLEIAQWLRECARDLRKHGDLYRAGRFTARFLYR